MESKIFNKMGVEIEGAWNDCSRVVPWLKTDGSVSVSGYSSVGRHVSSEYNKFDPVQRQALINSYKGISHSGEIASHPLSSKGELDNWLNRVYPDSSNETCGIHVHASFHDLKNYAALMTQSFYEMFLGSLHSFGELHAKDHSIYWNRFIGNNTYCRKIYNPSREISTGDGKYRLLNYSHFHRAGGRTFECRAFPAFQSKEVAREAIYTFLNIIRNFLIYYKPTEEEMKPYLEVLKECLKRNATPEERINFGLRE